jgi:putative ABC transport system substrate-binding protein
MPADGPHRATHIVRVGALAFAFVVLTSVLAEAEQAKKVYRIGFLGGTSAEAVPLRSLRVGLRDLGYAEGRNVTFEYRFAQNQNERRPALAAELVRMHVDVIIAHASTGTHAAKQARARSPLSW